MSETDKFFEKYEKSEHHKAAVEELLVFILEAIGEDHGAKDALFNRAENEVQGLPLRGSIVLRSFKYYFPRFPLRLYALKIRENIVILFNGGVKDGPTNQTSSLEKQWKEACQFARKIDRAIVERDILIDEENGLLLAGNHSEEIFIF